MKKKQFNILFRTSGGQAKEKQLGFGHIFRCINLAKELNKNKIFFLLEDYGNAKKTIRNMGFKKIFSLSPDTQLENDFKKTLTIIQKQKIDIMIIDKYKTQKNYLKKLSEYVKVVYISDLEKIEYPANLVFNGFIGFSNQILFNKYGTKCFVGPSYQILNKKFKLKNNITKKKFKLLVTFGGFDEANLTTIFLKTLSKYPQKIKVKVILGPGSTLSQMNYFKNKFDSIYFIKETKNMYKEIASCEYGLCSGGLTSYEFVSMHIPFGIICQTPHQLKTANEWKRKNIGENLGLPDKGLPKRIEHFLDSICKNELKYSQKRSMVDGMGAERICKEILKLK